MTKSPDIGGSILTDKTEGKTLFKPVRMRELGILRPYHTVIQGWDIPKKDYLKAHKEGGLVKLAIELSNVCNLSCSGCFTKRTDESWTERGKQRLPNELSYDEQVALLREAASLGTSTVDIVGAGEPMLDKHFTDIVDVINGLGMHAVVFTHGAQPALRDVEKWRDRDISFFLKLWSLDPKKQAGYVAGSLENYTHMRNDALRELVYAGFTNGPMKRVDGMNSIVTRLGADILVMRSNYEEIPQLFSLCRMKGVMPLVKTYIPEGPTRFSQTQAAAAYTTEHVAALRQDEVSPADFARLRSTLRELDYTLFGEIPLDTLYPGATKCTQSMASLYVTIQGDIRGCVGTHLSYGRYQPGMLAQAIKDRKERVGFGCIPRLEDAKERGLELPESLKQVYDQ
ncbi:MAG: radical SAM protein [Nanoarchaeota archaeon]|nr:radical SAM protein [Nanoarchaeota archaeon]